MKPLGGTTLHSTIYAEKDRFVEKHIHVLDTKIESAEGELKTATETEKEKISSKIAKLRVKRTSGIARIKYQGEKKLLELQGKLESNQQKLQKQIGKMETEVSGKKDDDKNERNEKKLGKYEDKIVKYEGKIAELKGKMNEFHYAQTG